MVRSNSTTLSSLAVVETCPVDANLKIRASGLMLGAMLKNGAKKFVLRFSARSELLACVHALRDGGARVTGDAPTAKGEPIDVKPFFVAPPPLLHLADQGGGGGSSSQLFAFSQQPLSQQQPDTVAAASGPLKRKAADDLPLPTPAWARLSSAGGGGGNDENAPPNASLLQRVAAVMAAPDFEAQVAAVERALSLLRGNGTVR